MSKQLKTNEKKVRRDVKKILKNETGRDFHKSARSERRGADARRAITTVQRQSKSGPLSRAPREMFARAFTERDAARLAWMLTVCDPFGKHHWSVPPTLGLGVPLSQPRIYRITLKGFAVANAAGVVFIGANADQWLPDSFRATGTNAQPRFGYLGNNPANGVGDARGTPVHYTSAAYVGCAAATPVVVGSTSVSYPGPEVTAATGLNFLGFPDDFVNTQLPGDATSGNAYQRCQQLALGLRVRPTAPASGALVPQGVILMTQQTLGDTVQTNAAAASSSSAIGGANCYAYMAGLYATASKTNMTDEMVGRQELDVMEWPRDKQTKAASWLSAAAIPNQSCSLAAYAPKNTGDVVVGYPQLAAIGAGMLEGQTVEFEASYIYAFYGAVSYEVNAHRDQASVPLGDMTSTVSSASQHMAVGSQHSPARQAVASVVQPSVASGELKSGSAAKWVQGGKEVIEAATGSSIGDLIGEGLGFLGAMLL